MLTESPWVSLLGMVAAVILIIGLAYWVTRRIAGDGRFQAFGILQRNDRLLVIAQTQIGKDQRLAVVQAGERFFFVGVTAQNISLLAELSKEEAQHWLKLEDDDMPEQTPSFKQALADSWKKRKQR